jgi:type VI protein secretion system component Hcp
MTDGSETRPCKRRWRFNLGRLSGGLIATPLAVALVLTSLASTRSATEERPVTLLAGSYDIYVAFHVGGPNSPTSAYPGYSVVSSVSEGVGNGATVVNPSAGVGIQAGPPRFTDVTITKAIDGASLKLSDAVARGLHATDVTIGWVTTSPSAVKQVVMQETLSDAVIAGYQAASTTNDYQEAVTIAFSCFRKDYKIDDKTGIYTSQWNIAKGAAGSCPFGRFEALPQGVLPFSSPLP